MIPVDAEQAPDTAPLEDQNDNSSYVIRSERVRAGMCPNCGTQLYKVKRKHVLGGILKKKGVAQPKPLTIEGEVLRGQCIRCMGVGATATQTEEAALAEALLLSEIEYHQSRVEEINDDDEDNDESSEADGSSQSSAASSEEQVQLVGGESEGGNDEIQQQDHPDAQVERSKSTKDAPEPSASAIEEKVADITDTPPYCTVPIANRKDPPSEPGEAEKPQENLDHTHNDDDQDNTTGKKQHVTETRVEDNVAPTIAAIPTIAVEELDVPEIQEDKAVPTIAAIPTIAAFPVASVIPEAKAVDSTTYTGEVNELGVRHGKGVLKWENGDRYEGSFFGGLREGSGTLFFANGGEYVGEWENNKMHGNGTQRFVNGDVYTGQFVKGKRSGVGRCYFANGDLYAGSWHDDKLNGFGTYYYNKGQSFQGNFSDNQRQGRGKYQYVDGRVDVNWYVNGSKSGEGIRWSKNRRKVWKVSENCKVKKRISRQEADEFVRAMGSQG